MTIAAVDAILINLEFVPEVAPHMLRAATHGTALTLYRVRLDDGTEGWGDDVGRPVDASAWVGQSALRVLRDARHSGLQMACFDAVGKALDLPAHVLMGRQVRDRVPFAYWTIDLPATALATQIARAASLGYVNYKFKCRPWWDPREQMFDGFVSGGGDVDGIRSFAGVAHEFRKPFWIQTVGTALRAAWIAHLASTCDEALLSHLTAHQLWASDVASSPSVVDGWMSAPTGPGLGMTPDPPRPQHPRFDGSQQWSIPAAFAGTSSTRCNDTKLSTSATCPASSPASASTSAPTTAPLASTSYTGAAGWLRWSSRPRSPRNRVIMGGENPRVAPRLNLEDIKWRKN